MSREKSAGESDHEDILDRLHEQGKSHGESIPEFDVEKTLRLLRAVRGAGAGEGSFWAALSPGEQADIVSAARKQTFPHGAVLMRQGERADHVMVILDGQARVSVGGSGQERIITARGPGDLVGEAGAEPGGVRSATVTAVGTVLALVIETGDFAAIVSEHPGMPDIVKRQTYDRLTGRPDPT